MNTTSIIGLVITCIFALLSVAAGIMYYLIVYRPQNDQHQVQRQLKNGDDIKSSTMTETSMASLLLQQSFKDFCVHQLVKCKSLKGSFIAVLSDLLRKTI